MGSFVVSGGVAQELPPPFETASLEGVPMGGAVFA